MTQKTSSIRIIFYFILSIIIGLPVLFYFMLPKHLLPNINILTLIGCHLMSCLILFFCMPKQKGWFDYKRKWPQLFFFLNLFLPTIGAIWGLFLYFFHNENFVSTTAMLNDDDDFFLQFQPIKPITPYTSSNSMNLISEEVNFIPLIDILNGNDLNLKRGAIDRLSKLATPESIKTLQTYRRDPSPDVRFFITTALTKIRQNMENELEAAHESLKTNPHQFETHIRLGRIYLRFALSNLLDDATKEKYLEESYYHLKTSLSLNENDVTTLNELLLCLESSSKQSERIELLKKMFSDHLINSFKFYSTMATIHFEQGDYPSFKNDINALKKEQDLPKQWNAILNWWGDNLIS